MIDIRPVSDLRNNFRAIEESVKNGKPVYLTKNGYGSMVVMSLEHYSEITNDLDMEMKQHDAD
jgi:prevent-host-death family protein